MAKQNEVTAASMVRRARAHGALAKSHRKTANDKTMGVAARQAHGAIAMMHFETDGILRAEAKEIRSHR